MDTIPTMTEQRTKWAARVAAAAKVTVDDGCRIKQIAKRDALWLIENWAANVRNIDYGELRLS